MRLLSFVMIVVMAVGSMQTGLAARVPTEMQAEDGTPEVSRAEAEAVIQGRLGGQRAGFDAVFGGPGTELSGSGTVFTVPGYGLVMVSFLVTDKAVAQTDVAAVIILRSERPENLPANESSEGDWTIPEADAKAEAFLPLDVHLDEAVPSADGKRMSIGCTSAALQLTFAGDDEAGKCQVTYLLTETGDVSFITLALGSSSTLTDAPASCEGMPNWSQLAASSMAEAQELVSRVAELDPEGAETISAMRQISQSFSRLAIAQELAPIPDAATDANAAMVKTFQTYATAFALAADAIEMDDSMAFEEAITTVEEASASFVTADERILEALETCRLVNDSGHRDNA